MKELKMLFSPIKIGTMELKNRCVMPPMGVNYAEPDGSISEREIAFYTARAKGGVGLIIVECTYVDPLGKGIPLSSGLWNDKHIPSWEKLAKAVHAYGAKLAPQLYFSGNKATPEVTPGAEVMGPSPISYPVSRGFPSTGADTPIAREMDEEDIERVVEAFGEAARRARDAGCDAAEIHAAHGYIFAQFMSPAENKRTDSYGGGIEGRIKFNIDVIKRIRSKVGNFPIIWRMSADEMLPGGRTIEETQLIVWLLADAGIDCIDVSRGSVVHSIHWILPPSGIPPATWVTQDTWLVKQVVDIPVIAVGKITDPHMAEFILESGKTDLVAFGRGLLADAELPNKAAAGMLDDIRYCIGCQGCTQQSVLGGLGLTCTMNPELGRELEMLPLVRAEKLKKVLVAGGGPGGLEAARVAALRGHDVTLYEKSDRLGGQFWIGALPPGKQELTRGIKWLSIQAKKAGAKIELGKEITPALVEELKPDVVIVATGGAPLIPTDIPGIDKPKVVTAHDVLTEKVRCGPKVVVLGASMVGCDVADWLGFHRKDVSLIKMRPGTEIGEDVSGFSKPWLMDRLEKWKVQLVVGPKEGVRVKAITDEGVVIIRDGHEESIEADNVVLALGIRPVNELAEQLKGKVAEIHVIGDAKEPRVALNAVREGSDVARTI